MKQIVVVLCLLSLLAGCAVSRRPTKSRMHQRIEKMFTAADADGDEWLTPAELDAGFPWLAGKFSDVDTDRNGKVSLAETVSYIELQSMQPEPKKKPPARAGAPRSSDP